MDAQGHKTDAKTSKQLRNPYLTTKTAIAPIALTIHQTMVAEAAYYLAERRGFVPGFELEDWLTAERDLDSSLVRKLQPTR